MGVIQRRRAAVSVSTLRNDVKHSVWDKQDGVSISRFCDHYMVCSQNARRLSAEWNLKEIEGAVEKKLKKRNQFTLWKTTSEKAVLKKRRRNWIQNRGMSSQITVYTSACIFVRNFRVNMVAAINWWSHTIHEWIWLVSCFGLNGPLRQYFSLYRTVFQRGRKKRER